MNSSVIAALLLLMGTHPVSSFHHASRPRPEYEYHCRAAASAFPCTPPLPISDHVEDVLLPEDKTLRVWAISDLHAQSSRNLKTVGGWRPGPTDDDHDHDTDAADSSSSSRFHDVLIVAGDVASGMGQIEAVLRLLTAAYDDVLLCVGNHELWVAPDGLEAPRRARAGGGVRRENGARPLPLHASPSLGIWFYHHPQRCGGGTNKQNENEKNRQQRRSRPPAPAAAWSLASWTCWSRTTSGATTVATNTSTAAKETATAEGTVTHDDAPSGGDFPL